ncbi:cyclic AMP receptor-like protein A [Halichondria panicea]|uniref:cyclic AMP receptor-like protein A n=1 Tax=Halichondria panicea TaxID=6063 RepID=UPI00312B6665
MAFKCPLFNYTHGENYQNIVINIRVSVACFSLLGSLFVIGLIWLFKKYKFYIQRLILYLSVSAFLSSTAFIMGRFDYDLFDNDLNPEAAQRLCVFQGFWLLYTDWTVLLSIFCITFNLLWTVFTELKLPWFEAVYFCVIFALPGVISCIPFYGDSFGPSGAWCWIRSKNDNCTENVLGTAFQFGVWYIPQYVFIILMFIMYTAVIIKLLVKTRPRTWQGTYDPTVRREKEGPKEDSKSLFWYPTVYFAVSLLPLINRIVANVGQDPIFSLYVLHVISSPLQGALTALAYALDKQTLRRLRWSNIKASFRYRNMDAVVKEYPVGPQNDEGEPFLKGRPKQT